jgi:purine nucleosidase
VTSRIVIDTDPGIDDAMAILFAHKSPDVSIEGLTTIMGNASLQQTTRNTLYLAERFGLDAPVFAGARQPLVLEAADPPSFVHGDDGLGNINAPAPRLAVDELGAAEYLCKIAADNPGEITIVALGRLTNLALAFQLDPNLGGKLKSIVLMGGAVGLNGHTGNVSPCAEANIAGDPHAADIVFQANVALTMVGLDVTMQTVMQDAYVRSLRDNGGEVGEFIYDISRFYDTFHRETVGMTAFPVHDSSAIAFAIQPELFQTDSGAIRVVTDGIACGQTIFAPESASFPPGPWDDVPAKQVCVDVDSTAVLELYSRTICGT